MDENRNFLYYFIIFRIHCKSKEEEIKRIRFAVRCTR